MKKLFAALLILCVAASLFAAVLDEPIIDYSDKIDMVFNPTLSRFNAMGQSGLAAPGRVDAFFTNPAALGDCRFGLQVPSMSFTVYNLQKMISDPETMEKVNALGESEDGDNTDEIVGLLTAMVNNLGAGYNNLMTLDSSLALEIGYFGLGAHVQTKFHTLANGNSNLASVQIIPEFNAAQTFAFGINIIESEALTVAAGISSHAVAKMYFKAQGANTIVSALNDDNVEDTFMWKTPVMAGYAFPIDLGATVGFANNTLRLSVTANNLNGTYYMTSYTSAGFMGNELQPGTYDVPVYTEDDAPTPAQVGEPKYYANNSQEFQIKTPMQLNFGFAWAPKMAVIEPVLTADLVDMLDMIRDFDADEFRASDLLLHLNAGAELTVLKVLNLRAGVNRGYMSIGAGIGLVGLRVEASYGWQEFGATLGDKPVDSFTVRVNLGVDR